MRQRDVTRRLRAMVREYPAGDFILGMFVREVPEADVGQVEQALEQLIGEKKLSRFYRVLSHNGGGIGDYARREDIPREVYDSRRGVMDDLENLDVREVYLGPKASPGRPEPSPWDPQ